jgi:hypothetical protein
LNLGAHGDDYLGDDAVTVLAQVFGGTFGGSDGRCR